MDEEKKLASIELLLNVGRYDSSMKSLWLTRTNLGWSLLIHAGTCPQVTKYTLLTQGAYFSTPRNQYLNRSHSR